MAMRFRSCAGSDSTRRGNTRIIVIAAIAGIVIGATLLLTASRTPRSALDAQTPEPPADTTEAPPAPIDATPSGQFSPKPDAPVSVEREHIDFGYVLVGQTVEEQIRFTNTSGSVLNVNTVTSSCDCTIATVTPEQIAPGQDALLTLRFTAPTYPHVTNRRSVRVIFDEYRSAPTQFTTVASVGRAIRVNRGATPILSSPTGEVTLEAHDGASFRVIAVDGRAPVYVDPGVDPDSPRTKHVVRYDFTDRSPAPRYLHVVTDRADDPMTEIPTRFTGGSAAPLSASPPSWLAECRIVHLRKQDTGDQPMTARVRLMRTRATDLSALSASCRPSQGDATIGGGGTSNPAQDAPSAVTATIQSTEADPQKMREFLVDLAFSPRESLLPGVYHDILRLSLPDGSYTELDVVTYVPDKP